LLAVLVVLFGLGIATYAIRNVGSDSFSRHDSIWKKGAQKAKKKKKFEQHPEDPKE